MFHDLKNVGLSPTKGKVKEDNNWHAGWWEFEYLYETARRPIEWSTSSTIFTAHPMDASVTGRHFSSSKQFVLAAPTRHPGNSKPLGPFDPPTVISVSSVPDQEVLFAYFPGRETEGIACTWLRTPNLDDWRLCDLWPVERGAGIVAGTWLGMPREWSVDHETGSASRLPPRGPYLPVWASALILVTQDNQILIRYARKGVHYRTLSLPLTQPGRAVEGHHEVQKDGVPLLSGSIICTHAAIGLPYQESSILIARRTSRYPMAPATDSGTVDLDLGDPPVINIGDDWSAWGEHSTIELAEVRLALNGTAIGMTVTPLPSISQSSTGLNQLTFIPIFSYSPAESSNTPLQRSGRAEILLTATTFDFGDYTATPVSELKIWKCCRQNAGELPWKVEHHAERRFTSSVLVFTLPRAARLGTNDIGIYVGILGSYGSVVLRKPRPKQCAIGELAVLSCFDLSDDLNWGRCALRQPNNRLGRELPLNGVISPNNTNLCTVSSGLHGITSIVHPLPKWEGPATMQLKTPCHSTLHFSFVTAILSRRSTAELSELLASVPLDEVSTTLYKVYTNLEENMRSLTTPLTTEILGLVIEVYRCRARHTVVDTEREQLTVRWRTAQDIVSLLACNRNFYACSEGDLYDLSSIWQLVGHSTWVVNLSENLMKECILSWDVDMSQSRALVTDQNNGGVFASSTGSPLQKQPLTSPILLFLAHPVLMRHLRDAISHVSRFHNHLRSVPVRGDNALIARDVLKDLIESSGIDLDALGRLLDATHQHASLLQETDLRMSLATCVPSAALSDHLRTIVQQVTDSGVLNKSRLFLKPAELVDDLAQLSLTTRKKDKLQNILTKGLLPRNNPGVTSCIRCGGKAYFMTDKDASIAGIKPHRWQMCEAFWNRRCICLGSWVKTP